MTEKEYILKGLKIIEEVKPSDAGRWLSFKIKFLPRLISFINGEKFEEKVDIVEEAEKIFSTPEVR